MTTRLSALLAPGWLMLFQPLLAFAQQAQQPSAPAPLPQYYWPGHGHMWGGGWGFSWICLLFLIALCVVFFFLGRRSGCRSPHHWGPPWHMTDRPWEHGHPGGDPTYTALQLLNERFARGEIQKAEYEEKKAAILSSRRT